MSCFFFFKQMTAYEMRISDWSSDVCSSDLPRAAKVEALAYTAGAIATALLLGGALLALRAAGEQVGWAFQLQHPVSVLALLILSLRSEEHTSELQSLMRISYAVFCLQKKKKTKTYDCNLNLHTRHAQDCVLISQRVH